MGDTCKQKSLAVPRLDESNPSRIKGAPWSSPHPWGPLVALMPLSNSQSPSQVGLPTGPGSRPPVPTVARALVAVRTSWGMCCSDASSWILISGHAGSPDLPASGWGDREGPGEGGRREPPHWPRGGTRETGAWMGGRHQCSPTPPSPSLWDSHP